MVTERTKKYDVPCEILQDFNPYRQYAWPCMPCVYEIMLNTAEGPINYIGRTKDLRSRLINHVCALGGKGTAKLNATCNKLYDAAKTLEKPVLHFHIKVLVASEDDDVLAQMEAQYLRIRTDIVNYKGNRAIIAYTVTGEPLYRFQNISSVRNLMGRERINLSHLKKALDLNDNVTMHARMIWRYEGDDFDAKRIPNAKKLGVKNFEDFKSMLKPGYTLLKSQILWPGNEEN
jgi:hypothetical protein